MSGRPRCEPDQGVSRCGAPGGFDGDGAPAPAALGLVVVPLRGGALPPLRGGALPPLRGGALLPLRGGAFAPLRGGALPPLRGGTFAPLRGVALEFAPARPGLPLPCAEPGGIVP